MAQEMLFGFCYMPNLIRVEDFSPYWVTDRWSAERELTDLKIMRAIGTSCLRVHMTPPLPGASAYDRLSDRRTVPHSGSKYLALTDLMVHTAHELGIKVHFDIGSDLSEVSDLSLEGWLPRYQGLVESYQFSNENYGLFGADLANGTGYAYEHYMHLLKRGRQIDPAVQFTVDMTAQQVEHARMHFPDLYNNLDVLNTHPYYNADNRAWTDEWIEALVAVHSPGVAMAEPVASNPRSQWLRGMRGMADFGKDLWITETAATGDGWWSSLVQDDVEAAAWRKGVQALSGCEPLKRIYWCWFTDKMHTVEGGVTQAGAVNYDGSPTPLTWAFKEMAERYAPRDSIIRRMGIEVDGATIDQAATGVRLGLRLINRSQEALRGRACLELPGGLESDFQPFEFDLQPGAMLTREVWARVGDLAETNNHVFLRVEADGQVHYGWGMVIRPQELVLSAEDTKVPGVRYLPSREAVQDYLSRYGDQCAVVVGPGSGHWDVELGFRMRIILQALRGRPVPIKTWFMIQDVWDQPLMILGRPEMNYIAQVAEIGLPAESKAGALMAGEGFVQVVPQPFGVQGGGGWGGTLLNKLMGYRDCPAALYISGGDDEGTRRAAYDLVKRLWHPRGETSLGHNWS